MTREQLIETLKAAIASPVHDNTMQGCWFRYDGDNIMSIDGQFDLGVLADYLLTLLKED